jgi:uncharacterized membrane protein YqjE
MNNFLDHLFSPATFSGPSFHCEAPVILFVSIVILYVSSLIWSFYDGRRILGSGIPSLLLVALLFWPFSLLIWLLLRSRNSEKIHKTEQGAAANP